VHWQAPRQLSPRDGAVVPRQVQRHVQAGLPQRPFEGRDRPCGKLLQRGVQRCCVLPSQQPDAAEFVRQGDPDARDLLAKDPLRLQLAGGNQWREDGANSDRGDACIRDAPGGVPHRPEVHRHDRPAIALVAAADHVHLAAHRLGQIGRPVHERRQAGARRQPDAQHRDFLQASPLDHSVGELRGADDHRIRGQRLRRRLHQVRERRLDAGKHVLGGRRLHRCEYAGPLDQRGIRVGAADIDPDAAHARPSSKIGR
jgi:hypothetical protein